MFGVGKHILTKFLAEKLVYHLPQFGDPCIPLFLHWEGKEQGLSFVRTPYFIFLPVFDRSYL